MNHYVIRYTIWNRTGQPKPQHKQHVFQSDNDLLAAADEGMCKIYDDLLHKDLEVLFRVVELTSAKEVYERSIREEIANA